MRTRIATLATPLGFLIPALARAQEAADPAAAQAAKGASSVNPVATWLRAHVPEQLHSVVLLLEHWQWLGLLALALVGIIVDRIVSVVVFSTASRIFLTVMPKSDVSLVKSALRPLGILAMAIVWRIGLGALGLPAPAQRALDVAVGFVAAAGAVWAAYRFIDILAEFFRDKAAQTDTRYDDLLIPLVRKSLKVFVVAFGLVFVADNLNVDITSLLAGLGLGGLAFALAAQDTVKNLFGSLTVLLDRPFQVGDWVVVGAVEGTVEEVGFRSTRIRTFYNSMITLPNSHLIATPVDNLGARTYRRWSTTLSLTYDTPPDKIVAFCEGVRELIRKHPHTRKDYFHVYANEFGAASLNVMLYVFFETPDWGVELQERHKLFLSILSLAAELDVEFAFPTQTLHVVRPGEMPEHVDLGSSEEALARGREAAGVVGGQA